MRQNDVKGEFSNAPAMAILRRLNEQEKVMKRLFVIVAALIPLTVMAVDLSDEQRAAIEERIQPYSKVCVTGDEACSAKDMGAAVAESGARSGDAVYNSACMACHATGAAGAPMLGDVAAWEPRIAKGMEALYDSGINGVAGSSMIAKGGCMDCSDEEIRAAVDFMVAESQ